MLAFDHGYFQGPTTGLERVDVTIRPLIPYADALMLTRGILRSVIEPSSTNAVVMRASGGPSILKELSNEHIAVDIEDALRMNVSAVAVQVFIGGAHETQTVNNMTRLVDMGMRYGMPVLGCNGGRHGARPRRPVHRTGNAHPGRTWGLDRQNLFCPGIRADRRRVPRADRDRGREEAS